MSTYQLLNGLSGNLQSSTSWSQQKALEQIQLNVIQAMGGLNVEQRRLYLSRQRDAINALAALEAAQQALTQDFKVQGLAQLREKIGGRDPEQFRIFTRYKEKRELTLPWEHQPAQVPVGYVPIHKGRARAQRDEYDAHYIQHLKDRVHIRYLGNGHLGFRPDGGSLLIEPECRPSQK